MSDAGIPVEGVTLAICPDNRDRIAAVVHSVRKRAGSKPDSADRPSPIAALRKLLAGFVHGAQALGRTAG